MNSKDAVIDGIAEGRANLLREKKDPPYVAHLSAGVAARLVAELARMKVPFGLPLGGDVPEKREGDWIYLGVVLGDVHAFGAAR